MSRNKINILKNPTEQQSSNTVKDINNLDLNKTNNVFQNCQEQEQKKKNISNKVPIIIIHNYWINYCSYCYISNYFSNLFKKARAKANQTT